MLVLSATFLFMGRSRLE